MYGAPKTTISEKNPSSLGGRNMHYKQVEGPLNCLSINKDFTQVVVAGRNVFRIFNIEDDAFIERINLRVGKHLNLNFSASDVAWCPTDDSVLASAATNGAVVVWDLEKTNPAKRSWVFQEHRRTVNKVNFHPNEGNFLISGSQDGSMRLFDLRKKEVSTVFVGKSESVRDVQFCPHQYFTFAAAFENGNVQIWDMRNPTRWERQFTGHNGPAFALDWHMEEKGWVATGGRDKQVKIWDLSNTSTNTNPLYSVQTITSVGSIKWRPQRKFHIASCALLVDCSINIWDIQRPYIPFATFNEHKDVPTGIVWKPNDPHVFLSSSKDCTLYQHMFRDAVRPADNANPVGIDVNIWGEIALANSDKLIATAGGKSVAQNYSHTKLPSFFRRQPDRSQQFSSVSSSLNEFFSPTEAYSMQVFVTLAQNYKLCGKSIEEIFDFNSKVARSYNRHQEAQTWLMLKILYSTTPTTPSQNSKPNLAQQIPHETDNDESNQVLNSEEKKKLEDKTKENAAVVSDEESDVQEADADASRLALSAITSTGLVTNSHSDFLFGDADMDVSTFQYEMRESMQQPEVWTLPTEAFLPRHKILDRDAATQALMTTENGQESLSSTNESEPNNIHVIRHVNEPSVHQEILNMQPFTSEVPLWKFTDLVSNMLSSYAEQGDVQMAATILIILGEKIKNNIDEALQEMWLTSYIELLGRFQLWSVANEVIKLSGIMQVSSLNQRSTTIHTNCSRCMKPLKQAGWLCERCQGTIHTCSICHLPVKGLYAWCQGCAHGGHILHIQEWLSQNKECPSGCGHLCEYT